MRDKACQDCSNCCPHCGCRLVRVCHMYCTTKTVIEYKYTCVCEEMCIPGVTPICGGCGELRQLLRGRLRAVQGSRHAQAGEDSPCARKFRSASAPWSGSARIATIPVNPRQLRLRLRRRHAEHCSTATADQDAERGALPPPAIGSPKAADWFASQTVRRFLRPPARVPAAGAFSCSHLPRYGPFQ